MKNLTADEMLTAFDESLEIASRWPRLMDALGYDPKRGRPGAHWFNTALADRGFTAVLDGSEGIPPSTRSPYPDTWWYAIAQEVTGDRNASVESVVQALRKSALTR